MQLEVDQMEAEVAIVEAQAAEIIAARALEEQIAKSQKAGG